MLTSSALRKFLWRTRAGLLVFGCTISFAVTANSQSVIKVAELSLRKAATRVVMPEFPPEAIKRRVSGVAVIRILYDENGEVIKTKVLEAPDLLTGNAVLAAVKQWQFQPQKVNGEPVRIKSKLTFYFVIEGGIGRVVNPKQVS
jgi:TonB family protein